jgi:hypothetical protein
VRIDAPEIRQIYLMAHAEVDRRYMAPRAVTRSRELA